MTEKNNGIPVVQIWKKLWSHKWLFVKVWIITFALSVAYIVPQPRTYSASTMLAPEMASEDQGSIASLASSFGFNLGGGMAVDAIYPELYPELMSSNEFIVSLFDIQVQTIDGSLKTDYYTYMLKHQKRTFYMKPIYWAKRKLKNWIDAKRPTGNGSGPTTVDPSFLTEAQFNVVENIKGHMVCTVDPLTNVVFLKVMAQDPLVAANLTDSICSRLQTAIINYRTKKSRVDVEYYTTLTEKARQAYDTALKVYSDFCDSHRNITLQATLAEQSKLETEVAMALNKYQAMTTQLEQANAKLQEVTPAFTTLQNASVPLRPSAPKRVFFCLGMLILATIGTTCKLLKNEIFSTITFFGSDKQK